MVDTPSAHEQRRHPRLRLPAAYTEVQIRVEQDPQPRTGHAYDISLGGMRFELDEPLQPGQPVQVEVRLPGLSNPDLFAALGRIVRLHAQDDPGPVRMGMQFTEMDSQRNQDLLQRYAATV